MFQSTSTNLIHKKHLIVRELGDGLILRRADQEDAEALAAFNARIHSDEGPEKPEERVGAWTRDLVLLPHPTFNVGDFTIVEDTRTGAIVSSLNLIPQTWTYGGIPFDVGRPELVGTLPEYRNRGLVRLQFEVIHAWSAERGYQVQAITGIPYYYRLFGYEMALTLGGGRVGYKPNLTILREGEAEPYNIRPATEADIPFIARLYDLACQRSLVSCTRDESLWRNELSGKSAKNINRYELRIIETNAGEQVVNGKRNDRCVGFLAHPFQNWGPMLPATTYELLPGISWNAVTPSVARYLYRTGESYAAAAGSQDQFDGFGFWGGTQHPVYQVMKNNLPFVHRSYAWYLRVADLPGFVRHITPVLEQRLSNSPYNGHSGELKLTFYTSGLHLVFEKGRLAQVDRWPPAPEGHSGNAAFPGLTFLQLLFGYRSLEELKYAFADCWHETDEVYGLLENSVP